MRAGRVHLHKAHELDFIGQLNGVGDIAPELLTAEGGPTTIAPEAKRIIVEGIKRALSVPRS
jgi:hypothetical protein